MIRERILSRGIGDMVGLGREVNIRYWLLGIATVVAAALRFYQLGEWSFWVDEGFTIRDIQALGDSTSILSRFNFLFFTLSKPVIENLGVSEYTARLLPALLGTLSVPLIYFIGRALFGGEVGLLAAFLLAVAPWHIYWSQNARFYTLLLLLYNGALFFAFLGLEKNRIKYALVSAILAAFALITHPTAAVMLPIVGLYVLLARAAWPSMRSHYNPRLLIPYAFLPLLYGAYELIRVRAGSTTEVDNLVPFFSGPVTLHGFRLLAGVVYYIGVPLVGLGIIGGAYLVSTKDRRGLFLLLSISIPLALLFVPISFPRYVFLSLPSWILLAVAGAWQVFSMVENKGRILALGVLIILLIDPISQDLLYYGYQKGNRADWRSAFELVNARMEIGDRIVTSALELGEYYTDGDVHQIATLKTKTIEAFDGRTWYVDAGWLRPDLEAWFQANGTSAGQFAVYLPGRTLDMNVYLYEPGSTE